MINTEKHIDFFNPVTVTDAVHIIGIGAIGSHIAEMCVRLGIDRLYIYDLDKVEPKNIANQMYRNSDIGKTKIEAMVKQLEEIDPDVQIKVFENGWNGHALSGFVFLCVDNIDLRRKIVESNMYNMNIRAMFDFRMRLADAQHYAAAWDNEKAKKAFFDSMQFTHEEAQAATPVSACGTTLSVLPTIRVITALGMSNFINYMRNGKLRKLILIDAFDFETDAMG